MIKCNSPSKVHKNPLKFFLTSLRLLGLKIYPKEDLKKEQVVSRKKGTSKSNLIFFTTKDPKSREE